MPIALRDFIMSCSSSILLGFYKSGDESPIEEIDIPETMDYTPRKNLINSLLDKYPKAMVGDFWVYSETIIAARAYV